MTVDAAFLCADICPDTCCCCGGSATLGGTQEAIVGSSPTLRYCSIECHGEWEDHLAAERERLECCPVCGFDCKEHAPNCTLGGYNSLRARKDFTENYL